MPVLSHLNNRLPAVSRVCAGLFLAFTAFLLGVPPAWSGMHGIVDVPSTGQATCYDANGNVITCAGTGQDGDIQAGIKAPNPQYSDNGDGTVTDVFTGLSWTADANLAGVSTWQQALNYVAGMNAGTNPNYGYTDWRLPNINELTTLTNLERGNPALATSHPFASVQFGSTDHYWSSTSGSDRTTAWVIAFRDGSTGTVGKTDAVNNFLWPVRTGISSTTTAALPTTGQASCYDTAGTAISCAGSGQDGEYRFGFDPQTPRFSDNGDGTVHDHFTALDWTQQASTGTGVTWQQALDYVAGMNAGTNPNYGYTDWRLPNAREINSLVDVERPLPGTAPFVNVQSSYWSSTSDAANPGQAWRGDMLNASLGSWSKADPGAHVWVVRGDWDDDQDGFTNSVEIAAGSDPFDPNSTPEVCDGIDNDLDSAVDEGFPDTDSDGMANCVDTDDDNDGVSDSAEIAAGSNPLNALSTPEVCDGIDNDLDGTVDDGVQTAYRLDGDGDGYGDKTGTPVYACSSPGSGYVDKGGDCDDANPLINPGTPESCNGIDEDCDGSIDEGVKSTYYWDGDSDGYGLTTVKTLACTPPNGYTGQNNDCNDGDPFIHPGATEACNDVDDDCDGHADEGLLDTYYADADGDAYGDPGNTVLACFETATYIADAQDCNDANPFINPNEVEICNNLDDNCDGQVDEGCPQQEACDGIDNDLDGLIDEGYPDTDGDSIANCVDPDDDGDGYSDAEEVAAGSNPLNPLSTPEVCGDGIDNDLDALVDEGCAGSTATPEGTSVEVNPDTDVSVTFDTVSNYGHTQVSKSDKPTKKEPQSFKMGNPPVYYDISTDAEYVGTAEVCITWTEGTYNNEKNLKMLHWDGAGWENITISVDPVNNIICGDTTGFSPFIVGSEYSVYVDLAAFGITSGHDRVTLEWTTAVELDNEGFNILRATSQDGPFELVNDRLLPATAFNMSGASYSFVDESVEPGATYFYQLEDVDNRGVRTQHGPLEITVADGNSADLLIVDESDGGSDLSAPLGLAASGGGCAVSRTPMTTGDIAGSLVTFLLPLAWVFVARRRRQHG